MGFYGGIAPTPISSRGALVLCVYVWVLLSFCLFSSDFCTLKSWKYNYKQKMQNVFLNHSVKWDGYPDQEGGNNCSFLCVFLFACAVSLLAKQKGLFELAHSRLET